MFAFLETIKNPPVFWRPNSLFSGWHLSASSIKAYRDGQISEPLTTLLVPQEKLITQILVEGVFGNKVVFHKTVVAGARPMNNQASVVCVKIQCTVGLMRTYLVSQYLLVMV